MSLPLDPHEGGDRTAFHPTADAADEEWGDKVVPKGIPPWNAPMGGRRGCPMKRRDPPMDAYSFRTTCFHMPIT
jgi:hypothetical protein